MSQQRVAIVYNDEARPETTGTYCLRALEGLAAATHFRPRELARIGPQDFDLFIKIDDGFHFEWPEALRPAAFWAIDTHVDFELRHEQARGFDIVFAAQRDGAAKFQARGMAAQWLPLACDHELHVAKQHDVKQHDLCFIGNLSDNRIELIRRLQRDFPKMLVAKRFFREMTDTYAATKIIFNCSVINDINMRVFEALASGSLLLTNDLTENGLAELFQDGVHLATYTCADELLDKAHYYLGNSASRERIAELGQREVLEKHTYRHRMETILEAFKSRMHGSRTTLLRSDEPPGRATAASNPRYFEFARPELLRLVHPEARRILEIGCGAGRLGASIKARQLAEVTGVELNAAAAEEARRHLDNVLVGDIETSDFGFANREFDCVICGDVLEHLVQPDAVLRKLRLCLKPGGQLVVSIPNARHHSVLSGLLGGDWTYESAGLLDRTHLRFFTRRDIEQLLYRTGFDINDFQIVPGPGHAEWIAKGEPTQVRLGCLDLADVPADEVEDFFAYQFLVSATRSEMTTDQRTSLVVISCGSLSDTQKCVESIHEFTDEPLELIFVDIGSEDGTVDYLRSLPHATVVENPIDSGIGAAVERGVALARCEQIVLLHNDVVVTTGWLRRLLQVLRSDESIGFVGPMSNRTGGAQQLDVSSDDLDGLESFAWKHFKVHCGQSTECSALGDFCLLMRRSAIGRVAQDLDSVLRMEGDLSRQLLVAGYQMRIARDAFVHHVGRPRFTAEKGKENGAANRVPGRPMTAPIQPIPPAHLAVTENRRSDPENGRSDKGRLIRLI